MAERLRKIADETTRGRVDLLRQQSKLTRPAAQRCVQTGRLVEPALFRQILDEPEAAQDERSLIAGNSIRRLLVEIPVEKSMAGGEALSHRRGRGDHPRLVRGNDASQRQGQEARIESPAAVQDTAPRVRIVVPGSLENGLADAIGCLPPGRGTLWSTQLVGQMRGPVQRDLTHSR